MGASNPDQEAEARAAEREYREAEEARREATRNLDDLYRQGERYAEHPPEGRLAFTRTVGGVAIFNHLVGKEQEKLAQAEMRVSDAERKLEAKRRERDEAREADRETDREDRARLREEMQAHHEGRDPFSDRGDATDRTHDRERDR